jgi:hypothetical protein
MGRVRTERELRWAPALRAGAEGAINKGADGPGRQSIHHLGDRVPYGPRPGLPRPSWPGLVFRVLLRELDAPRPADAGPPPPPPAAGARPRGRLAGVALLSLVLLLGAVAWASVRTPSLHGDTAGLVQGANGAVHCLARGQLTKCDRRADGRMSGPGPTSFVAGRVGQWPLLQYLVAVPMRAAGVSADLTLRTLVMLNALALVGLVALVWLTAARAARAWGPVLAVVMVTGPLLWYSTAAFGEALACFVAALAVATVLTRRSPWIVGAAVVIGGFTKETTPPFLFVLCAVCVLAVVPERARRRAYFVAIVVGTVVSVVLSGLFNIFRFGSFMNSTYMQSTYRVSDTRTVARFFGALWASPNGGLLWFWPAAVGVVVLVAVAGLRRHRGVSVTRTARVAGLVVLGLLVVSLAGLAGWFSPFGWIAWGPRLALPLIPAMVLTAAVASGVVGAAALQRVLRSAWFWLVGVLLVVAVVPQVAVVWNARAVSKFFVAGPGCANAHVESRPHTYYACVVHKAWDGTPLLVRVVQTLRSPLGFAVMGLAVIAVATLLLLARAVATQPEARRRVRVRRAASRRSVPDPVLTRVAQPS